MTTDGNLRPIFRKHLPMLMWTSIETGGTGLGVPDSHYLAPARLLCRDCNNRNMGNTDNCVCRIAPGIDGMIEYKKTGGYTVDLRPEQVAYLTRRARLGGRAWIAVRRRTSGGPRSTPADELHLLPASLAGEAKAGGLRCAALAVPAHLVLVGGPARWPWSRVLACLLS